MTDESLEKELRDYIQQVADEKHMSFERVLYAMIAAVQRAEHKEERGTMLIKELAAVIHQNAVDHGWWDEPREMPEVVALIHSEWSEALEEARAGRPLVWYACGEAENSTIPCNPKDDDECRMYGREGECQFRGHKPEGIAVELIDGCIRILDAMGYSGVEMTEPDTLEPTSFEALMGKHRAVLPEEMPEDAATLIAWLHAFTSQAMLEDDETVVRETHLISAMSLALCWVQAQGVDPLALLLEKHEYNKGRPYKHGKKF